MMDFPAKDDHLPKSEFGLISLSLSSDLNFDDIFAEIDKSGTELDSSSANESNESVVEVVEIDKNLFNFVREDYVELDSIDLSMDFNQTVPDDPTPSTPSTSTSDQQSEPPPEPTTSKAKVKGRSKGKALVKKWNPGRSDGNNPLLAKLYEGHKKNNSLPVTASVATDISRIRNREMRKCLANFYHSSSRSHMLKKK